MRQLLLVWAVCIFPAISSTLTAQCISGDCHSGYGTYTYQSGAKYIGQFQDGKIHGDGILYFSNGNKYIGQWVNHYRQGRGKLIFAVGDVYEGDFNQSKFSGRGTMTFANGDRYEGQWADDMQHGHGVYFYLNGDRYEGNFERGKINGQGTMFYQDGAQYSGLWKNNKKNGQGTLVKTDGSSIAGFWENGSYVGDGQSAPIVNTGGSVPATDTPQDLPNCNQVFCATGMGVLTYNDGSRYVGNFANGNPEGQGTCYYANGDKYVGGWGNHAPHGEGVMYYANGRVLGAMWEYGRPLQEIEPTQEMPNTPVDIVQDPSVKIWAVVVGVARYTHMPTLKYTDDDAYHIYAFLKSPSGGALPDEQVQVLIDESATRMNILSTMRNVFLKADENDVVIFYFSGHGLQGSFLPSDFDGFNNKLMHEDIKTVFSESRAKHKVCLADACHSGSMTAMRSPISDVIDKYYKAFEMSTGGTALLVSSKGDEYSLEDMGLRQGIFSHFLIHGLKGQADTDNNRIVTIQELFNFIHTKVRNYTANAQTPEITGQYDPRMPIAVVR